MIPTDILDLIYRYKLSMHINDINSSIRNCTRVQKTYVSTHVAFLIRNAKSKSELEFLSAWCPHCGELIRPPLGCPCWE